jgi:dephospho-CoA kinase
MTNVVGLTGGIGSGKSTVAGMLEKLGASLIDVDALVHELQRPGAPLLEEIAAAFGPEVIGADGALEREALGAIVFRDPEARQTLNRIVHPKLGAEVSSRMARARQAGVPLVVLDIPLLFEGRRTGSRGASTMHFDVTIVVFVPRETQIERQLLRERYDRGEAELRVDAQMPLDEKRALADFVIDNSGNLASTERQVREIYAQLTGGASPRCTAPSPAPRPDHEKSEAG